MSKLVLHIVFLLLFHSLWTQENLVPNGSFEEYDWCPYQTNNVDSFYINASKYWTAPTLGTPDYYNVCSVQYDPFLQTYLFSVPENINGNQLAHSGNAYGGFVFTQNHAGSQTYSEYVQVKLNRTLISDKFYELKFYINNPRTDYCINSVGALFTSSELSLNTQEIMPNQPQFTSDESVFFCDTSKWYEVKGVFLAKGDESYLSIGEFKQLPELQVKGYNGSSPPDNGASAYFYIDDVSLVETDLELANAFTPNGDGINDTYTLDLKILGAKKAEIINRWGNIIISADQLLSWDGTYNGHLCSDGVYFLRIQFENNIVNGFIHVMK